MIKMWKLIKFQDSLKKYFFHEKKDKILNKMEQTKNGTR